MKQYTQTAENVYSLRLMLKVDQFDTVEPVIFAYNLLQPLGDNKTKYIMKAMKHFEESAYDSGTARDILFPVRCMKFIKSYYSIDNPEDVANLLSQGTDSATFRNAEKRMIKHETPRTMLLGFNKIDPEHVKMHEYLFQMDVVDRILLISKAIERYVKDGMDSAALMAMSYGMVHDSILEYEKAEDKNKVISRFVTLMEQADNLCDKYDFSD